MEKCGLSWKAWFLEDLGHVHAKLLQSCPTLYDPMDCSPPGFSVHGILQAGTLEWVAISFSRGPSQPRDWIRVSYVTSTTWEALNLVFTLSYTLKTPTLDLPGGAVDKNLPANAGTQAPSLVWEDSTGCRATKPVRHNHWTCATT